MNNLAIKKTVNTEYGVTVEHWEISHNEEEFSLNSIRAHGRLDAYRSKEGYLNGEKPIRGLSEFYDFSSDKNIKVTRTAIFNEIIRQGKLQNVDFSDAEIVED